MDWPDIRPKFKILNLIRPYYCLPVATRLFITFLKLFDWFLFNSALFVVIGLSHYHSNHLTTSVNYGLQAKKYNFLLKSIVFLAVESQSHCRVVWDLLQHTSLVTLQEFSIQHNLHRKCLFSVWKLRQQHIQDQVSKECRIFQCILCLLEVQVKSLLFGYFCAVHSVHFLSMKNWPIHTMSKF